MTIRQQRYTAVWLYTIFALIIPVMLVLEKFDFFSNPSGKQFGMGAIIILCLVAFYFRHHISQWVEEMQDCMLKYIAKAIKELMPLLIVYAVFAFLSIQFVNISFILKWSCVSNIIAIIIRVWHLKCLSEIKKEESKGE